jgi:hypothetical protein
MLVALSAEPIKKEEIQESKVSEKQQLTKEALTTILDKLSNKFKIDWVFDETISSLGQFRNGVVIINPNKAKADTPFHEFAHPFVAVIKQQNPLLYNNLKKQLLNSEIGKKTLDRVRILYSEKSPEEQIEEAIVDVIGQYAANQELFKQEKGLWNVIKTFLRKVSEYLKSLVEDSTKAIIPSELSANTTLEELATMLVIDNPVDVLSRNNNVKSSVCLIFISTQNLFSTVLAKLISSRNIRKAAHKKYSYLS